MQNKVEGILVSKLGKGDGSELLRVVVGMVAMMRGASDLLLRPL